MPKIRIVFEMLEKHGYEVDTAKSFEGVTGANLRRCREIFENALDEIERVSLCPGYEAAEYEKDGWPSTKSI